MSNLLIGSSNIYRNYKKGLISGVREYTVVKCTQMEVFSAKMASLKEDSKSVLISVIENFISDAVGMETVKPEALIEACITEVMKVVEDAAIRLPDTKFGFAAPLQRPALLWYQERRDKINNVIGERLKAIKLSNVTRLDCCSSASQQFETDMVHLTPASAKVFLEILLGSAEDFFTAETVDLEEDGEITIREDDTLEKRVKALEDKLCTQSTKNSNNDLMFARLREEMDTTSNKAREDRVVINGLKSKTPMPTETRARIDALRGMAAEIFLALIPDFKGKIVYLTQGKNITSKHIPMVEVKLDNAEQAH
jgi:hypothetical protein